MTKKKTTYLTMGVGVAVAAWFLLPLFPTAELVAMLKISRHAANRVIDIISAAGTVYAIVGIVAAVVGGGGIGVAILASAKALAKRYGKTYAAAW